MQRSNRVSVAGLGGASSISPAGHKLLKVSVFRSELKTTRQERPSDLSGGKYANLTWSLGRRVKVERNAGYRRVGAC